MTLNFTLLILRCDCFNMTRNWLTFYGKDRFDRMSSSYRAGSTDLIPGFLPVNVPLELTVLEDVCVYIYIYIYIQTHTRMHA